MECPDKIYLSLYVDGELSNDTPEYKHIEHCEKCQKQVKTLQSIGNYIQKKSENFPKGLIDRIKKNVKEKLSSVEFVKSDNYELDDSELENLAAANKDQEHSEHDEFPHFH